MPRAEARQLFHYRAAAPEGGVITGQLLAADEADAIVQLRHGGYTPLRVQSGAIQRSFLSREITLGNPRRLRPAECEELCRELSILLASGLELADAVGIMIPSLGKRSRLLKFAVTLRQGLRLGRSFAQAAEQSGYVFPPDFVPVVRAGEDSASLGPALAMLAETYSESGKFARVFVGALIYPGFLLLVAVLTLGIIAFFVAPNLAGLFASMDKPVPLVIAALNAASAFLGENAALLGVGAAIAVLALAGLSRNARFRAGARGLLFRAPLIGQALVWSSCQRFAATLRLYIMSNVAIASALPSAFTAAGFPDSRRRAQRLGEEVRRGSRLSAALDGVGLFPAKVIHLVRVGENSGRLPEVLEAIVSEAKIRFEKRMTLLSALLAPSLILLVGILVGSIIFAVFSALLEINELTF